MLSWVGAIAVATSLGFFEPWNIFCREVKVLMDRPCFPTKVGEGPLSGH